jgi:parallel beta-helix repeat protein
MANTPNFGLYKPNRLDTSVEVDTSLSDNFTKIDTEMKVNKDAIETHKNNPNAHTSENVSHADGSVKTTLDNHETRLGDLEPEVDGLDNRVTDIETLGLDVLAPNLEGRIQTIESDVEGILAPATFDAMDQQSYTFDEYRIGYVHEQLSDIAYNTKNFPVQVPETDDTSRLQRAIDQATANNKRLAITGNVTTGLLNVTCDLIGLPGHQITLKSGARLAFQKDTVTVENLNIVSQSNKVFRAAYLAKYKNIIIKNCKADFTTTDTGIYFLELLSTEKVTVKDCVFNVGGISVVSADECLVQGNIIDAQYLNDNEPIQVSTKSVARILDNTIYNSRSDMIDLYSSGYETIVRGNKGFGFKFSTYGASCMEIKVIIRNAGDANPGSNEGGFVRNTIVSDNIMKDIVIPSSYTNSNFFGIYAQYLDQRTPGPAVWDATQTNEGMIIKNNIIENVTYEAGATGNTFAGIDFAGINGIIDGNIIKNINMQTNTWGTCGIHLGGSYAQAVGVQVINNVLNTSAVGILIDIAQSVNISNNIIRKNDRNTIQPRYGIRVLQSLLESNVNNNVIHALDFPIDTLSTATIQKCNFNNNQIKATNSTTGTILLSSDFQFNNFNNNVLRNTLVLAQPTALKFGNTFKDNKFFLDTAGNGVFLDFQNGFTVSGNTFDNATNGIRLLANCQNGILKDNISRQSAATVVNNGATVNIIQLDNMKI